MCLADRLDATQGSGFAVWNATAAHIALMRIGAHQRIAGAFVALDRPRAVIVAVPALQLGPVLQHLLRAPQRVRLIEAQANLLTVAFLPRIGRVP